MISQNKQFLFSLFFLCFSFINIKAQDPKANSKITTVDYCDLVRALDKYDNKVIQTEVIYKTGYYGSVMYDITCKDEEGTWVKYDDSVLKKSTNRLVWEKFHQLTNTQPLITGNEIDFPTRQVKVVWVGLFQTESTLPKNDTINTAGFGHLVTFHYQFIVQKIEKVTELNPSND